MRTIRPLSSAMIVSAGLMTACGLERPIEQQPLVSVVEEWRQSVLEANTNTFSGTPVEVPSAEVEGDFGELRWPEAVAAESTGSINSDMLVVELLAGGLRDRWGMAIVGIHAPSLSGLQPGVRVRLGSASATIIGCSGMRLNSWEYDDSAWDTDIAIELDATDPTLVHYDFSGEFYDGTTLSGQFTVVRPDAAATTP